MIVVFIIIIVIVIIIFIVANIIVVVVVKSGFLIYKNYLVIPSFYDLHHDPNLSPPFSFLFFLLL